MNKMMKFKRGKGVEVLRRIDEQWGSWFPGKIISVDGDQYIVRYDLFLNLEGEQVVEKVHQDDVRPQPPPPPPPVKEDERWVFGDIAEVYLVHCWRVGKVVKVLRNNRFVIRLFGSIELKEFHKSSLRVRQAWKNNKWVVIGTVVCDSSNYYQSLDDGTLQSGFRKETCPTKKDGQGLLSTFPHLRTLKRTRGCQFESLLDDTAMEFGCRRRKRATKAEGCYGLPMRTLPSEPVDVVASSESNIGKRCTIGYKTDVRTEKTSKFSMRQFPIPVQTSEESNECSVASCSSNDSPVYNVQHSRKLSRDVAGNSFDDAESFCPLPSFAEDEPKINIRKLELNAYKKTVQALYASGPLSWEQESLLTNLRLSLRISNEEHLLHLKQLLSAQIL